MLFFAFFPTALFSYFYISHFHSNSEDISILYFLLLPEDIFFLITLPAYIRKLFLFSFSSCIRRLFFSIFSARIRKSLPPYTLSRHLRYLHASELETDFGLKCLIMGDLASHRRRHIRSMSGAQAACRRYLRCRRPGIHLALPLCHCLPGIHLLIQAF